MTASKFIVIPILTCIFLLIDWYVWQAVKVVFGNSSLFIQTAAKWVFWSITIITISGLWVYNFFSPDFLGVKVRTFILYTLFAGYAAKLFAVFFILIDDFLRLFEWSKEKVAANNGKGTAIINESITRSDFLMKTALVAATIPAVALTWGIVSGAHDYRLRRVRLKIKNLPKSFEGMTIGQISDIHSGSFFNKKAVKGGVEMLLKEKPEMVFFTGDLVNDRANEVREYINIFDKIKAPLGVFSTLGNHDYGDYMRFPNEQARIQNMKDLKFAHKVMGYDLLLDENRMIELSGERMAIIGVENISGQVSRYHNYGNLSKAVKGTDEAPVKLLLSHDPTHWDMEVNNQYKDIDVMFSGHTHGLQFGISVGDKTYSPAQWQYKQWAGLYENAEQQLYVNRGFGYMGYPGRVGMPPEITIFELVRS